MAPACLLLEPEPDAEALDLHAAAASEGMQSVIGWRACGGAARGWTGARGSEFHRRPPVGQ